jgi:hypothetical protein
MQARFDERPVPPASALWPKLFVFGGCGHSEFIHSDRENRPCLFSDCECSGLALRTEQTAYARPALVP